MVKHVMRKIWADELDLQEFSDDDDFFSLGGHSLIMTKIQLRIRREVGLAIPMDDLFRHATINGISDHAETLSAPPVRAARA
jgi:acyl carrier protein